MKSKVKISSHARARMAKRGLTEAEVRRTVHHPDHIYKQDDEIHLYQREMFRGKTPILRVVLNILTLRVITTFKTRKIKR